MFLDFCTRATCEQRDAWIEAHPGATVKDYRKVRCRDAGTILMFSSSRLRSVCASPILRALIG